MTPQNAEVVRKIQELTSGGYRISVPKSFAEGHEKVVLKESGEYLIARPNDVEPLSSTVILDNLPENLDDFPEDEEDALQMFIENMLQSCYIAGANKIEVPLHQYNENIAERYREAFQNAQQPIFIEWDLDDDVMEVKKRVEFEDYSGLTRQFLHNHLITNLSDSESRVKDEGFLGEMEEKEAEVDRFWSLASRELGEIFFELDKARFGQGLGGIYAGKYLELAVDDAAQFIRDLNEFEEEYSQQPALVDWVREEFQTVFINTGETYDKQLVNLSNAAYNQKLTNSDYIEQYKICAKRREKLDSITSESTQVVGQKTDKLSPERAMRAGVFIGSMVSVADRLIQFPRSIVQAGIGTAKIDEVHNSVE